MRELKSTFKVLEEELKKIDLFYDENGQMLKQNVLNYALDESDEGTNLSKLLEILSKNEALKKVYFKNTNEHLVFLRDKFIKTIAHKEFLPSSYTSYMDYIGLSCNGEGLRKSANVVLDFPYKDCVLEGGQTKEEQKMKEVFYNETLANDEIDRLFHPKAFKNIVKYLKEGQGSLFPMKEEKPLEFSENDNLLIKGNNLLALHSIVERYEGKIKLIYIDPPYNTENDSFQYNDKFTHSTWLTFMKNRLEIARTLLKNDGTVFIQCDNNEQAYLKVLLDEVFGRDNFASNITYKRGSATGHKAINAGLVNTTEYILVYCKNKKEWKPNRIFKARSRNDRYDTFIRNIEEHYSKWQFCSLLDAFSEYINIPKNKLKKELGASLEENLYDFVKQQAASVVQKAYPDFDKVSKETKELINLSKASIDKVFYQKRENESDIYLIGGNRIIFYKERLMKIDGELSTGEPLSDLWDDILPNDLHNEGGVSLKKGKKPEKLIKRIIEIVTNKQDIILDFFAGSGTTASVSHKMGRQWITIEQLDYNENDSINRLKNVLNGEQGGISKAVNWYAGGSFVYCELAEENAKYTKMIDEAKNDEMLIELKQEVWDNAIIRYEVEEEKFVKNGEVYNSLTLEDKKQILKKILDKNHLYINYSEMEDGKYTFTKEEKAFNKSFYEVK